MKGTYRGYDWAVSEVYGGEMEISTTGPRLALHCLADACHGWYVFTYTRLAKTAVRHVHFNSDKIPHLPGDFVVTLSSAVKFALESIDFAVERRGQHPHLGHTPSQATLPVQRYPFPLECPLCKNWASTGTVVSKWVTVCDGRVDKFRVGGEMVVCPRNECTYFAKDMLDAEAALDI